MSRAPLYVAVEGPIGVGKTTLVRRLAERLQAELVLEAFEENPFLTRFYEDKERWAFSTQLFFLMSRYKQQRHLLQPDLFTPNILADYHLFKDRIFAELTLEEEELSLYEAVYQGLSAQILKPDVVIYLSAPLETLLARIQKRGRDFEKDMDPNYLRELSQAYQRFFSRYEETALLRINNTAMDYSEDGPEAERIIDAITERLRSLAAEGPGAKALLSAEDLKDMI